MLRRRNSKDQLSMSRFRKRASCAHSRVQGLARQEKRIFVVEIDALHHFQFTRPERHGAPSGGGDLR
jgi:hypothetical protein